MHSVCISFAGVTRSSVLPAARSFPPPAPHTHTLNLILRRLPCASKVWNPLLRKHTMELTPFLNHPPTSPRLGKNRRYFPDRPGVKQTREGAATHSALPRRFHSQGPPWRLAHRNHFMSEPAKSKPVLGKNQHQLV